MKYFTPLVLLLAVTAAWADTPASTKPQTLMVETRAITDDSLESIFNAFIATYAKEHITWKSDIVLTSTPREIPPGRQLGLSYRMGYYTFVPKTWCDFTEDERNTILHDPKLRAFMISLRRPATYPQDQVQESAAPKAEGFDATKSAFPMTGRQSQ